MSPPLILGAYCCLKTVKYYRVNILNAVNYRYKDRVDADIIKDERFPKNLTCNMAMNVAMLIEMS